MEKIPCQELLNGLKPFIMKERWQGSQKIFLGSSESWLSNENKK